MMKPVLLLVFALMIGNVLCDAGDAVGDMTGLLNAIIDNAAKSNDDNNTAIGGEVARVVDVNVQLEEVWAYAGYAAQLFCDYTVSTGEDLPVTVTWKVGDGPRMAGEVMRCSGYTQAGRSCDSYEVVDSEYFGRVRMGQASPSLEIITVRTTDNRNYWCQVSLDDPTYDVELGFDMKSVVLRIRGGPATPKFHSVQVTDDILESAGNQVTLDCICSGSHCDDVYWYKGPTDPAHTNYDLVYSRTSHSRPIPTKYQAYNRWVDRAHLSGNSLVITDLQTTDSGRYWCEVRSSGFYGIGEFATDARSVVLEIREAGSGNAKQFNCVGKDDGLYADPGDCAYYFECVEGRAYHRQCPYGTVYNEDAVISEQACDFAENVATSCGTKPSS